MTIIINIHIECRLLLYSLKIDMYNYFFIPFSFMTLRYYMYVHVLTKFKAQLLIDNTRVFFFFRSLIYVLMHFYRVLSQILGIKATHLDLNELIFHMDLVHLVLCVRAFVVSCPKTMIEARGSFYSCFPYLKVVYWVITVESSYFTSATQLLFLY